MLLSKQSWFLQTLTTWYSIPAIFFPSTGWAGPSSLASQSSLASGPSAWT
jgi:hypothetical protein